MDVTFQPMAMRIGYRSNYSASIASAFCKLSVHVSRRSDYKGQHSYILQTLSVKYMFTFTAFTVYGDIYIQCFTMEGVGIIIQLVSPKLKLFVLDVISTGWTQLVRMCYFGQQCLMMELPQQLCDDMVVICSTGGRGNMLVHLHDMSGGTT